MIRSLSLFLAAVAVASTASLIKAIASKVQSNSAISCRAGFSYYQGWCVLTTDPKEGFYQSAVDTCASVGAFAPSIHTYEDVDFWSDYAGIVLTASHFWLDAYCPSTGQRYAWLDGTPTNYAGPNNEFLNCDTAHGFHMQYNGLDKVAYGHKTAPAVCVYDPIASAKTTITSTTPAPTTTHIKTTTVKTTHTSTHKPTTVPTTRKATTPSPTVAPVNYCTCNMSSIYLDIVFVVDTSGQMAKVAVAEATATIQSVLSELTLGTETFQSNVAAIAFAEDIQTEAFFGDLRTPKDISNLSFPYLGGSSTKMAGAINQASSMISAANARNNTRGVIVLLSNSFNNLDALNIKKAATAFENNGGILITIDYSLSGVAGLDNIANPEYYIKNAAVDMTLPAEILYALCDANCFCRDGLISIDEPNENGRTVPQSCYQVSGSTAVYYAAEHMCNAQKGFVATIHDDTMNFFMTSLFPVKTPFWIGLERNATTGIFEWSDGSKDNYTNWAPGNPVNGGFDCVYGQQQSGFNSPWFSAPCNSPLDFSMLYACQLRPCSSEFVCSA